MVLQHFTPLLNEMEDTCGLAWPPLLSLPASSASEQEEEEESGESTGFEEEDEETEEDQAFIDDDELEDEGLSFYRRVDLEQALDLAPLTAVRCDPTPPTAPPNGWRKKTQRLLTEFGRHVTQLVVVGFTSGKYDLNVLEDILIPQLVHRSGIDLTIKRNYAYLALRTSR